MTLEEKVPMDLEQKEADPQYSGSRLPREDVWLPCPSPRGPKKRSQSISSFLQLNLDAIAFSCLNLRGLETLFFHPPGTREPLVLGCHATPSKPKGPDTQCGANFFK